MALQAEILVGAWLLMGRARVTAWLTAVTLFAVLAGVSISSALAGHSDCGCFGRLQVHPWYTSGLNLACLTLLASTRPPGSSANYKQSALVVATLAGLAGGVTALGSSPIGETWAARLRGDSVLLTPAACDLGSTPAGETLTKRVAVTNLSDRDVRLIGGSVSCSCTTTRGLPVTVPAGGTVDIEIEVKVAGTPGRFAHSYELFTDIAAQPKLQGQITGTVSEPAP